MDGRWVRSVVRAQRTGLIDYGVDLGKLPRTDLLIKESLAIRDYGREADMKVGYVKLAAMLTAANTSGAQQKHALLTAAEMLSALTGEHIELDLPITEDELVTDPALAAEYYERVTGHSIDG